MRWRKSLPIVRLLRLYDVTSRQLPALSAKEKVWSLCGKSLIGGGSPKEEKPLGRTQQERPTRAKKHKEEGSNSLFLLEFLRAQSLRVREGRGIREVKTKRNLKEGLTMGTKKEEQKATMERVIWKDGTYNYVKTAMLPKLIANGLVVCLA